MPSTTTNQTIHSQMDDVGSRFFHPHQTTGSDLLLSTVLPRSLFHSKLGVRHCVERLPDKYQVYSLVIKLPQHKSLAAPIHPFHKHRFVSRVKTTKFRRLTLTILFVAPSTLLYFPTPSCHKFVPSFLNELLIASDRNPIWLSTTTHRNNAKQSTNRPLHLALPWPRFPPGNEPKTSSDQQRSKNANPNIQSYSCQEQSWFGRYSNRSIECHSKRWLLGPITSNTEWSLPSCDFKQCSSLSCYRQEKAIGTAPSIFACFPQTLYVIDKYKYNIMIDIHLEEQ